jgi:hypothetical protein
VSQEEHLHTEEVKKSTAEAVRKPMRSLGFLAFVMFVLLLGGGVFLAKLNNTVNHVHGTVGHINKTVSHVDTIASNTDQIVSNVAGPEAQKKQIEAQKQVISDLVSQMDCRDQQNLQRLINDLIAAGMTQFAEVKSVVEPRCQPQQGETP